jgi:hypothetical protein
LPEVIHFFRRREANRIWIIGRCDSGIVAFGFDSSHGPRGRALRRILRGVIVS